MLRRENFNIQNRWIIRTSIYVLFLILASKIDLASGYTPPRIKLKSFKTYSRISFPIDSGVDAHWKSKKKGFELLFKGISLVDMGAPLGKEKEWFDGRYINLRDNRLKSITFKETDDGLLFIGAWKFPTGDSAPANPQMEWFDFRSQNPAEYVIDFWVKKGPSVAEMRVKKRKERRAKFLKQAQKEAKSRAERRIAKQEKLKKITNLNEHCEKPLNEKDDIFLEFKPIHTKVDFNRWFSLTTADKNYPYLRPNGNSVESKYVRLALSLYDRGKPGLTVRAIEFLEDEFPDSIFMKEMKFLKANAFIKLGFQKQALNMFRELLISAKESPVALYAGMFTAAMSFEREEILESLDSFMWLIKAYPDHRLSWVFHLGAAETLYKLRQADRAAKEYKWVMENTPEKDAQAEAGLRVGDLYMERRHYAQALAAYYLGLKHYSKQADNFSSIFINRAEALYWLDKFDRSLVAFKHFLEEFSSHRHAWRATFRIGEIYGRKKGDENRKKSREWYYKTINQYPYSPGAALARLRLLPCGDHAGLDFEGVKTFLENDVEKFNPEKVISSSNYQDLYALTYVRTLISLKKFDDALSVSKVQLRKQLKNDTRNKIGRIYKLLFRKAILAEIEKGDHYAALEIYDQFKKDVSKYGKPIVPDYLMKLSQTTADLHLPDTSEKLVSEFRKYSGIEKSKNRMIAEQEKQFVDLDLKLIESEEYFTEAKALWLVSGMEKYTKIKELLNRVVDESKFSFEKEIILGLIEWKNGKPKNALVHAIRADLLMSQKEGETRSNRLDYWVAELQSEAGDLKSAASSYRSIHNRGKENLEKISNVDEKLRTLGLKPVPSERSLLVYEAEVFEKMNDWRRAANIYNDAIKRGVSDNRIQFGYANALGMSSSFEDLNKSRAMMEKIVESEKDDFWRKLAKESLENEDLGK